MTNAGKLLVVDDDGAQMRALCTTLEAEGYWVAGFTQATQALAQLREQPFDLLLTDLTMPEMDGIALFKSARQVDPHIVGIVMTGHGSIDTAVAAMKAGALDYILKPFTLRLMRPVLERALTLRRLLGENLELRRTEELIRSVNADLERQVDARTRQLTEANRELEAFARSVSHDLRAPLRTISGFGQVLREDFATGIDERGRDYLDRIVAAAGRMHQLIDDLMRLSYAAGAKLAHVPLDLAKLGAEILAELREREPDRRVEIRLTQPLMCVGDAQLLRIALENLLGNAWKFTRHVPDARIEMSVSPNAPDSFIIRDNGAGFDPKYAGELFAPFQRLHSNADFPGTGVGLSIVQRIIRRHGGQISAEGAVGQGATFTFSLPTPAN